MKKTLIALMIIFVMTITFSVFMPMTGEAGQKGYRIEKISKDLYHIIATERKHVAGSNDRFGPALGLGLNEITNLRGLTIVNIIPVISHDSYTSTAETRGLFVITESSSDTRPERYRLK